MKLLFLVSDAEYISQKNANYSTVWLICFFIRRSQISASNYLDKFLNNNII